MKLNLKSHAKINLFLRVINKREDGYHNIETHLQKISLYDKLSFHYKREKNLSVEIEIEPKSIIIPEEDNLIKKAILLFNEIVPIEGKISVKLEKNIPIGAGLGGGSSNAASTLIALNAIKNYPLPLDELLKISKKLGADVPFFVSNMNSCIAKGIGDQLFPTPPIKCHILLIYPGFNISTKEIYQNLDLTKKRKKSKIKNARFVNDLEEVAFRERLVLIDLKFNLERNGADLVRMSGSGSSIFGVFSSKAKLLEAKEKLEKKLKDLCLERGRVIVCKTLG